LFFDEAEKAKREYDNKSWWQKLKDKANQSLTKVGPLYAGVIVDAAPSAAPSAGGASEAPEISPSAAPTPLSVPSPPNTVVAREKIIAQLPIDTIEAQEKSGGDIIEEAVPQDIKIPPAIIEETVPDRAKMPSPSPIPAPFVVVSGGGSNPSPMSSPSPVATSTATSTPDTTAPETMITVKPESIASTTTAIFEFNSSESDSTFSCQLDNASSTDCSSPQEYINLAEGSHAFKVGAADAAGNRNATSTEYSWRIDFAPEATIDLSGYDLMNIDFTVNWSSSSTDIGYYDVQYKIGEQGAWQSWAMATITTSKSFQSNLDNIVYYFRARAVDSAGQASVWQEIQAPVSIKPIIFNEIMYDPNPGSDSYYEYVELYNRSPIAIDLANWKFVSDGREHVVIADTIHNGSSTVIASGGFALLADRTESTSTPSIYDGAYYAIPSSDQAHLRLTLNGAASLSLTNLSNDLILKNAAGSIVDRVNYSNSWRSTNDNGNSLERINYNSVYSDFILAWGTSAAGGTPNAQNDALNVSAGSMVRDNTIISKNTVWGKAGSPYVLYSSNEASPMVSAGATLTIEPGATIKPLSATLYSLYVKGAVKAVGTSGNPILFTSNSVAPQAGDWGTGLYFAPDSLNSELSFVTFEYGGYRSPFNNNFPAVAVNGAKVDINNCIFRNIQGRGLELTGSDLTLSDSQFLDNDTALYLTGSSAPIVKNNTFRNSANTGTAIRIENQNRPAIESNDISGFQFAVWLESAYPVFSGNNLVNNSFNGVNVSERTVLSKNTTWQREIVYILRSDIGTQYPTVTASSTLTIEPGAVIKAACPFYPSLKIDGTLVADGQSSSTLITFTSFMDDSSGGDTNNDGLASEPNLAMGEWRNIIFAGGSQATLKFIKFKYGGYSRDTTSYLYYNGPILDIKDGATVTQENVTVE